MITGDLSPSGAYRVAIPVNVQTGLSKPSEIMAEKTMVIMRTKCGPVFGRVPDSAIMELNEALMFILGLDDA
jgi:mRNA interferase MazF